jgi:hypothetical protein
MLRWFLLAIVAAAFPAEAVKQPATPKHYGAIAYHRASQSWGVSADKVRARDASVEALQQCGHKQCEVILKIKNGCGALADGPKAAVAASGATRDEAETKAVRRCGTGCTAIAWACTR